MKLLPSIVPERESFTTQPLSLIFTRPGAHWSSLKDDKPHNGFRRRNLLVTCSASSNPDPCSQNLLEKHRVQHDVNLRTEVWGHSELIKQHIVGSAACMP